MKILFPICPTEDIFSLTCVPSLNEFLYNFMVNVSQFVSTCIVSYIIVFIADESIPLTLLTESE